MKLKCITLSGVNENFDVGDLFRLCQESGYSAIEYGVQVSDKKAAYGMARYNWLSLVHERFLEKTLPTPTFALHVNGVWAEQFCFGNVPDEIVSFLAMQKQDKYPFIKRIQLNFKIGREKDFTPQTLVETMKKNSRIRFILSWNKNNAAIIREIYRIYPLFDCLYDSSGGEGILANVYQPPVFPDCLQGYSGGLSPENIHRELSKIAAVVPENREIWIDAEGRLKGDKGYVVYDRCLSFVHEALHSF